MSSDEVRFGDFRLDIGRRELLRDEKPIRLGSRALEILCALASAPGAVVTKGQILNRVWPGVAVEENAIPVHISALRKALADGEKSYVVTEHGRGYRLIGVESGSGNLGRDTANRQPPPVRGTAIAVLPFLNRSDDPKQEYFAAGIVDDIITGLARIEWLSVIGWKPAAVPRSGAADAQLVGRELGVRYVLEGSVRKAGDRVRIACQFVDAETGVHLWAERYDRTLRDIFAVQDEIAMSVVGALEPNLRKVEIDRVRRKRPDNLDAYDLVLRALPQMKAFTVAGATAAIPLLENALELEPEYAYAHALLARSFHFRFSRGGLHEEDRSAALRHARAAVSGDNDDATTLAIAALVIWFDEHDVPVAFELFDRALDISNSNVVALGTSAFALAWMGNAEAAIERAQRALDLSPFDRLNAYLALAVARFHAQQYEQARDAASRAAGSHPDSSVALVLLAVALVRLGRIVEAKAAAQRALALDPTFTMPHWRVTVGLMPEVFTPFAEAWQELGVP